MRTRLRFAALVLAAALSFAVSARPAAASDYAFCKTKCVATGGACLVMGGDAELCGGWTAGCVYGCGVQARM